MALCQVTSRHCESNGVSLFALEVACMLQSSDTNLFGVWGVPGETSAIVELGHSGGRGLGGIGSSGV